MCLYMTKSSNAIHYILYNICYITSKSRLLNTEVFNVAKVLLSKKQGMLYSTSHPSRCLPCQQRHIGPPLTKIYRKWSVSLL